MNAPSPDQIYNINIASKDSRIPFQPSLPNVTEYKTASGKSVDGNIVNYVYNKFIELLQVDKNATIESILREEPVAA